MQIFVDPKSILYLHGMTLDYKESLMQSASCSKIRNAKKSCGCGTSFARRRSDLLTSFFERSAASADSRLRSEGSEKRFYALSRKLHPDRFARKSADEQQQRWKRPRS